MIAGLPHVEIDALSTGIRHRVVRSRVVEAIEMLERAGVLATGGNRPS